jgi:hypothetical protein
MRRQIAGPRKQRTREHVIADLSVNHVERLALEQGHTAQRVASDYGYDLVMWTFDGRGYVEPGSVLIQIKAAEVLPTVGEEYTFDADVRDYNLWMREETPVILILYEATRRRAYWLFIQDYFASVSARRPRGESKTIRVRVPKSQTLTRRSIDAIRNFKNGRLYRIRGVIS